MGSTGSVQTVRELPQAVQRTLDKIVKQTANLKKEQYRIVDTEGNIIVSSKGTEHQVGTTVGEKRKAFWDNNGMLSIHNHPEGGTFSDEDFDDFGFGATDVFVAAPEGVYRLAAIDHEGKHHHGEWVDMRDAYRKELAYLEDTSPLARLKQAQENLKNSKERKANAAMTEKWAEIDRTQGREAAQKYWQTVKEEYDNNDKIHRENVRKEERRLWVEPNHEWLKKNAKKYGYVYTFTPHKKK